MEVELKPLCEKNGLGTTIYSPLASGMLTGKYNNGVPRDSRWGMDNQQKRREFLESTEGKSQLEKVSALSKVADDLGVTMPQLALAWCLKNPHVSTVILGATRPEQITENVKALDVVDKITDEVFPTIQKIAA
ncbi:MAG: aldo/keto reductase, partial [Gammaproteobacteria bacterium]|nr:aldo/keto reductase [Gammaproteobacteria bacterium]